MARLKKWPDDDPPATATGQKRALLLLRVSDAKQLRKDVSIPAQRTAGHQKAKELGAVVVDEVIEPGYSGRDIEKRPIFRDMIARIKAAQDIDYVIVYAFSRFARNVYDHSVMKVTLEKLGVKVVSATENIQGDKPSDRAMENMIAVFNEFRSLVDGEDIKYKMGEKARNGGTTYMAPLGYLNTKQKSAEGNELSVVVFDRKRAPLVKMAFELYATGRYTLESLQAKMAELGLRTRGNKRYPSGEVSRSKLGYLLRDRYYIGYVKYNDVEYKGNHKPLVSIDLFERVQRVMDAQSGAGVRQRRHNHYLKGLLWCHRCGKRLIVMPGQGNGGLYLYFLCRGRQEGECDLPYIRVEKIEQAVLEHYATVVFSNEFRAEVVTKLDAGLSEHVATTGKERKALTARLVELERKEEQYFALVGDSAWPQAKLSAKMAEVQQDRDKATSELAKLDTQLDVARDIFLAALELLRNPQELYAKLLAPERRLLTQLLFVKLKIDDAEVADDELQEPFDALVPAGRAYELAQSSRSGSNQLKQFERESSTSWTEGAADCSAPVGATSSALLGLAAPQEELGSSKGLVVPPAGFEPATCRLGGGRSIP